VSLHRGNLFLVGLMGAGKTTLGRQLARRLDKRFVDADHELEARLGVTIPTIFEIEGEAGFRDREEAIIDELTKMSGVVLATGGGAVLRPANRECLHAAGNVFYLRSTPEDVFRRLRHDKGRPLLQVDDPLKRLRDLYVQRDPLYRETAQYVIETGRPSVPTLVNMIVMQLELNGSLPPPP
jgi:shikimate kinase